MKLECHEIEELTGAYLADQLTVQERYRMEMHLNSCVACTAEIAEFEVIAGSLWNEFDAENQDPALDASRREILRTEWNQSAHPSLYTPRSKWRTARRVAITLATAASILMGSYLGFVSGNQRVQTENVVIEIATLPTTITATPDHSSDSNSSFVGTPYSEFARIMRSGLPEYGIGSAVFASRPSVSRTRAAHMGLPVPSPNYHFDEPNTFGYE